MTNNSLAKSFEKSISRLRDAASIYDNICNFCEQFSESIISLNESTLFDKIIENFGPCLSPKNAKIDLKSVYDVAFHKQSRALIIANKGVTIPTLSPFSGDTYITRHIACSVYHPNLGLESVNIGLIGNVYEGQVILRAESACPPAFIFGSQRCNCCYQWASVRELAAHFNKIEIPLNLNADDCEKWAAKQFTYKNGKHLPTKPGRGLVLMHLDSQAGMGSGISPGEFVFDLYNRALMRQLGENTTEQVHHMTIKEGYEAIGVSPDSRRQMNEVGYQIPAIILVWLGVSRNLIVLSNNHFKIKQLSLHGFEVTRIKSLGKVNKAGQREAKQRGEDFQHLDMDGKELTFEEEILRLKEELPLYTPSRAQDDNLCGHPICQ